jgi:hypothetical protein
MRSSKRSTRARKRFKRKIRKATKLQRAFRMARRMGLQAALKFLWPEEALEPIRQDAFTSLFVINAIMGES